MRYIYLLLLPSFLFSDHYFWTFVNTISQHQDEYARKTYKLSPCSSGGNGGKTLKLVVRWYEAPYSSDLTLARTIIVDIGNRFLCAINNESKLRPFLDEIPFSISGFDITILFEENAKLPKSQKQLICASLIKGKIHYSYDTHTYMGFETYHRETFAEASAIVQKQNEKMKQTSPQQNLTLQGSP